VLIVPLVTVLRVVNVVPQLLQLTVVVT